MPMPIIEIDDNKCNDPLNCRVCLLACPARVIGLGTNVSPQKFKETEPTHFIARGVRFQYCTLCMDCVKLCPKGAITVTAPQGVAA